jgi:hypothetical protein
MMAKNTRPAAKARQAAARRSKQRPRATPAKSPAKSPAKNPAPPTAEKKPGNKSRTTIRPKTKQAGGRPDAKRNRGAASRTGRSSSDHKRRHTAEIKRGGPFLAQMRLWRILHDDGGQTVFTKDLLAQEFFKDISADENPEPESPDDLDLGDIDEDDDAALDMLDGKRAPPGGRQPKPYAWIREKHKRLVQRLVETLKKCGIVIHDLDDEDKALDDMKLRARLGKNKWAERRWRYDPNGEWAQELTKLLETYHINGPEIVAFMALGDLLEDMRGTGHQKALQHLFQQIKGLIPHKLLEQAQEQSRSYRHSVGNTAKYLKRSADLERWYEAVLRRMVVDIDYAVPGYDFKRRRIAALSTVFNREENALYLLGSEPIGTGWGPVKQWKMDRVKAIHKTDLSNPTLEQLKQHELIEAAPGAGDIERLDPDRVFDYSAGAWLEIGETPKRLELVVRIPQVDGTGLGKEEVRKLRDNARRRAYGWMAWCREKPLHPMQFTSMEMTSDGEQQMRLVVERCYVKEMASRVLRLQDCFEVIEPRDLAVLVGNHAAAIAISHRSLPPRS